MIGEIEMPRRSIPTGPNRGIRYEEHISRLLREKGLAIGATGGASSNPDVHIMYNGNTIPLEIKKDLSADFAQIELRWDRSCGFYFSPDCQNPSYREFLTNHTEFLQQINNTWTEEPRKFTNRNYTLDDLNSDLDNFRDIKVSINAELIEEFYTSKNPSVNYMQIGEKGFYYLKENIFSLNADRLVGEAVLRARVKTRSRSDLKWGFLVAIKLKRVISSEYDIEEQNGKCFPFCL